VEERILYIVVAEVFKSFSAVRVAIPQNSSSALKNISKMYLTKGKVVVLHTNVSIDYVIKIYICSVCSMVK